MDLRSMAQAAGFAACYVLEPKPYPDLQRRRTDGAVHIHAEHLADDARAAYPWANAIVLLVHAYRPYAKALAVSGYYPASNRAYHAANALLGQLTEAGVRAERADIPLREAARQYGIGMECTSGLLAIPPYGTRVVLQALAVALPSPAYEPVRPARQCPHCGRCARACPGQAIGEDGFAHARCVRAYMDGDAMPTWTMNAMTALLGCEECQFCCPLNAGVPVEETLPEAFRLERILSGEIQPVLALIGKNMRSGGRITAQAAVMAQKSGRADLLPLLLPLIDDERPAVQSAARYAISRLQDAPEQGTIAMPRKAGS